MLGINLMKAVVFVQHLAACTGFCGNGIGRSVLKSIDLLLGRYCVKEVSQ